MTPSSFTSARGKYEVIRAPSEYCATSSGIAITSIRERTHPALPSFVRTKDQSSIGGPVGLDRRFFFLRSVGCGGGGGGSGGSGKSTF